MTHYYNTVAEIKRTCTLIADTKTNYYKYDTEKKYARDVMPFQLVTEYESLTIYSNGAYYILIHQDKNISELYKLIR